MHLVGTSGSVLFGFHHPSSCPYIDNCGSSSGLGCVWRGDLTPVPLSRTANGSSQCGWSQTGCYFCLTWNLMPAFWKTDLIIADTRDNTHMSIGVPGYMIFPHCTDICGFCMLRITASTVTWKQKLSLYMELMNHFLLYSGLVFIWHLVTEGETRWCFSSWDGVRPIYSLNFCNLFGQYGSLTFLKVLW